MAPLQGKTVKQYTLGRLSPADEQAWRELRVLLSQSFQDGLSGKVSAKSISAILDKALGDGLDAALLHYRQ